MTQELSHYAKLISEFISEQAGCTDPAMAGLVEALMYDDHGALDSLTLAEFSQAVMVAMSGIAELHQSGHLVTYCEGQGIAVPAVAA